MRRLGLSFALVMLLSSVAWAQKLPSLPSGASAEMKTAHGACRKGQAKACGELATLARAAGAVEVAFAAGQRACDLSSTLCDGFRPSGKKPGPAERAVGVTASALPKSVEQLTAHEDAVRCDAGDGRSCAKLGFQYLSTAQPDDSYRAMALFRIACARGSPTSCEDARQAEHVLEGGCRRGDPKFCLGRDRVRDLVVEFNRGEALPASGADAGAPWRHEDATCSALGVHRPCEGDSSCGASMRCVTWALTREAKTQKTCELPCDASRPCPDGMVCQSGDGRGTICHVVESRRARDALLKSDFAGGTQAR